MPLPVAAGSSHARDHQDTHTAVRRLRQAVQNIIGAHERYTKTGAISATSTGTKRLYNDTPHDRTIINVRASLATAPSTTSVIVNIKMNGTTIYTTTANRPTLTVGTVTVLAALPDVTLWPVGSYLTVDVTQADVAAADLQVQVTYA